MDGVWLREAKEKDVAQIVNVIRTAFEEYRGRLDPPSGAHEETVDKVRQKMTTARVVVATLNQEIVGCVFYDEGKDHLYLYRLAVLPGFRRLGIGHALIDWVEDKARALGYLHVQLSVRIALPENRAYYERLGYRVIGQHSHPGFTVPTYVTMEKELV